MLDVTLSTSFVPGANVKGQTSGANWVFLRPALPAGQVVCLGVPAASTLATLARLSDDLLVVTTSARQMQKAGGAAGRRTPGNVRFWVMGRSTGMPLRDRTADVLLVAGWRSQWRMRRDARLRDEVRRILRPDALVYYEYVGTLDPLRAITPFPEESERSLNRQRLRLTPWRGEIQTAVPATDRRMISFFRQAGLTGASTPGLLWTLARQAGTFARSRAGAGRGPSGTSAARLRGTTRRWLERAGDRLRGRHSWLDRCVERHGVFVGTPAAALSRTPPEFLRTIAAAFGVDLDRFHWGLSAPGEYSSRKLVFYLAANAPGSDASPRYIAKMVREPIYNARLENEYRALSLLCRHGAVDRGTIPQAVFFGHHGGLAIIGETVVDGSRFTERTSGTAECPYLHAAVEWFTRLAAGTVDRGAMAPGEASGTLAWLLTRFNELYHTTASEQRFLNAQIATLASGRAHLLPTFQHGDPGTWNMLVTPGGRVALLDWEAAEPRGMPLWDLFYFLRTYAVGAARLAGTRDSLDGFTAQLLCDTPLSRMAAEATRQYCEHVGLSKAVIEPLFYSCWMHRALKEATRLTPSRLGNGHYVNLLRLVIARHRTPALRRLFGS